MCLEGTYTFKASIVEKMQESVLVRLRQCSAEICFSVSFILLMLPHHQNHSFKNREMKYRKNIHAGRSKERINFFHV